MKKPKPFTLHFPCLLIIITTIIFPTPIKPIGVMHGVMHITKFTPNISTKRYSLNAQYNAYLQSMYNDQEGQGRLDFRLPVQIHSYRKQHEDGTWRMQNYVQLPFPIYYDHMRALLLNDNCDQNKKDEYEKAKEALSNLKTQLTNANKTLESVKEIEDYNDHFKFTSQRDKYLTAHLKDVDKMKNLIKREKELKAIMEGSHCEIQKPVPESFVFIFDNPDSEDMIKIRSRREPEHVIPRHDLFYEMNKGLQLYFFTEEANDLVARFDEGDMPGDQFGAILHTLKFPHKGHFSANFYIERVERFDMKIETQLKIVDKNITDLTAEEIEKMTYKGYKDLQNEIAQAEEDDESEVIDDDRSEDQNFLDYKIKDKDKLMAKSMEETFESNPI